MTTDQDQKFDMLRRVQKYLNDFTAELSVVNHTAARQELDQIVQQVAISEAAQATSAQSAKGYTARKAVLRRALWTHHMRPVATIAAAHLHEDPGFSKLRMPADDVSVAVLVQAATAMADASRPHQEVFVANGRPENFADALLAAAAEVRGSVDARAQSIGARAQARDGLKAALSRSSVVVRLLDAQVKSALVDDPKTLAGWKSAKRLVKRTRGTVETTAPTQATPVKAP